MVFNKRPKSGILNINVLVMHNIHHKWMLGARTVLQTAFCWSWSWWRAADPKWCTSGSLLRSPLLWQKSSCRMVCIRESVLRVRSNSGPTFGSRAPFTHCSWDDVTRLIRASEICIHTHTDTVSKRVLEGTCKTWREKRHSQTNAETENSSILRDVVPFQYRQRSALGSASLVWDEDKWNVD